MSPSDHDARICRELLEKGRGPVKSPIDVLQNRHKTHATDKTGGHMRATNVLRLGACGVAAIALASVPATAAMSSSPTSSTTASSLEPSPDCYQSPYVTGPTAAQACGDIAVPLNSTRPLDDGGTEFDYVYNGHTISAAVPPDGFNPLTATPSQVDRYGLANALAAASSTSQPDKARLMRAVLSQWHSTSPGQYVYIVPQSSYVVPTPGVPTASGTIVGNKYWSGYVAQGHEYTYVDGEWTETAGNAGTCQNSARQATWVGIGGYGTPNLAQDGTVDRLTGAAHGQFWTEVLPDQGIVLWPEVATTGSTVVAEVQYLGHDAWTQNVYSTNGASRSVNYQGNGYSGTSAEVIVERPPDVYANGDIAWIYQLFNYGSESFTAPDVKYSGDSHTWSLNQMPNVRIDMVSTVSSNYITNVSGWYPDGSFHDAWTACN